MTKGAGGHGASICSVASPKKWAKSSGNGNVLLRSLVRSKQTCYFVWPWGKHSVTDPGWEWGHPVACIAVLSGCILLTPLLLDSCCWGYRWSLLKEWYNCSSVQCGCIGFGDGEVCLGVLWKPREVSHLLADTLMMDSAAALCFYSLCYGVLSSLTESHLLATWQPPSSWGWPSSGWKAGLQVHPSSRQGLSYCHCTLKAGSHQAFA